MIDKKTVRESFTDYKKFDAFLTSISKNKPVIDNSSLNVFNLCPRKFFYSVELGLQEEQEPEPLTYGQAIHDALYLFMSGASHDECLKAFIRRTQLKNTNIPIELDKESNYSVEWGVYVLKRYFNAFKLEDEWWQVVKDHEGNPYLELGFALDLGIGIFVGRIDGIVRSKETNRLWIIDHKTTRRKLNNYYLAQFNPNNQLTGYCWPVTELMGEEPEGCIANCIRVYQFSRGDEESLDEKIFTRAITYRNREQILSRILQIQQQLRVIEFCRHSYQDLKIDSFWMNAPQACDTWFKRCAFTPLCQTIDPAIAERTARGNFRSKRYIPFSDLVDAKRFEYIKLDDSVETEKQEREAR